MGQRRTVLIVDDEQVIREGLLSLPWDELGFQGVRSAADGGEAVDQMSRERVDLVITDVRMPVMDGLELARIIQERWPDCRTIVLTGFREFDLVKGALKARVLDYLLKPVDPVELESVVRRICGQMEEASDLVEDAVEFRWAIQQAIRYIGQNLQKPPTLSEAAALGRLNPAYFSQQFKKALGINFIDYLRRARMEEACRLLRNSDLKVYEVAESVGYHDQKHFNLTFRDFTGMSPLEFRKGRTED